LFPWNIYGVCAPCHFGATPWGRPRFSITRGCALCRPAADWLAGGDVPVGQPRTFYYIKTRFLAFLFEYLENYRKIAKVLLKNVRAKSLSFSMMYNLSMLYYVILLENINNIKIKLK
jgi:hypothetical protein